MAAGPFRFTAKSGRYLHHGCGSTSFEPAWNFGRDARSCLLLVSGRLLSGMRRTTLFILYSSVHVKSRVDQGNGLRNCVATVADIGAIGSQFRSYDRHKRVA